jgi:hypothetical protein
MRLSIILGLVIGTTSLCLAQTPGSAPVPADAHELVTGAGAATARPADRTQSFDLLNRAKRPMRLHAPITPKHLLTASFTATGDAANSGTGELTELWMAPQNWRWTAKLGSYSLTRVNTGGTTYDEKPAGLLPMRVHMLRNAIFWAAQNPSAGAQFRSAAVEWNGRPATCLLVSDEPAAADMLSRRWDETEYCIDNQTGLLQILSWAPGIYTVYSYAKGESFHGQPMPDRITMYVAKAAVIDAAFRMEDAADTAPLTAAKGLADGPAPPGLDEPSHMTLDVPDASVSGAAMPAIVNAQVSPDGAVTTLEVCASADPLLASAALNRVKGMKFGGSPAQRQHYVQVRFVPASSLTKTASPPARSSYISISPYTLERSVSLPPEPQTDKEILALRSDGATLHLYAAGLVGSKQYARDLRFPDGRWVTVYDSIKARVTWPALSAIEVKTLVSKASKGPDHCNLNPSQTLLRQDRIEGQQVDVIQQNAGGHRMTLALAPGLGCHAVYVLSEAMRPDGSFHMSAETKTTRLVLGEPEAKLFEIAPDLVEMKPSEARRRLFESTDLTLTSDEKAQMLRDIERQSAELDRRYESKK